MSYETIGDVFPPQDNGDDLVNRADLVGEYIVCPSGTIDGHYIPSYGYSVMYCAGSLIHVEPEAAGSAELTYDTYFTEVQPTVVLLLVTGFIARQLRNLMMGR